MGGAGRDGHSRRHPGWRWRLSWLVKRSISLAGHRTSIALEPEFWAVLDRIAAAQSRSLAALLTEVDAGRDPGRPLASMLRVLALQELPRFDAAAIAVEPEVSVGAVPTSRRPCC